MTFMVSSFDLSHGSQIKVATKSSSLYSVLKHAVVLFWWGEHAEDPVFMYGNSLHFWASSLCCPVLKVDTKPLGDAQSLPARKEERPIHI